MGACLVTGPRPPDGMQRWEQLTLFQPDAVTVEMILHISDTGRLIDGGVRVTDSLSGDVYATEALHWPPTLGGIAEAAARYLAACHYWAEVVWYRTDPLQGGEAS